MNKENKKFFLIFWLIAGIVWAIATIRHILVYDDFTRNMIYGTTSFFSFLIAFAYYKGLKK